MNAKRKSGFIRRFFNIGISLLIAPILLMVLYMIIKQEFHCYIVVQYETFIMTMFSCMISIGITLFTLSFSNDWYNKYTHFQEWGIIEATGNREGGRTENNQKYRDIIKEAKDSVTIIGVSLGHWFTEEFFEYIKPVLSDQNKNVNFYFLNPSSKAFYLRAIDERTSWEKDKGISHKNVYERIINSLEVLKKYLETNKNFQEHISIFVYDATPLGVIEIDNNVYLTHYLPYLEDLECPELHLDKKKAYFTPSISNSIDSIKKKNQKVEIDKIETENQTKMDIDSLIQLAKGEKKQFEGYNEEL
jgi:hypothetical protein